MTVYLGTFGQVELKRQFDGGVLTGTVLAADVDENARRFSFDFEHGQLLTGDQIEIRPDTSASASLSFITIPPVGGTKKFINVDDLDGIRLYDSFGDAVNGGIANATSLSATGYASVSVIVKVENADYRILGRVQNYELNTTRETVDTTTLSDEFRSQLSTIMSGSGRMACEWEYTGDATNELPHYLLELAMRTKVGSSFAGRFYIKTSGYNPANHTNADDDAIWYETTGVITACAVQFTPNQLVQITADFITTGSIEIKTDFDVASNLLLGGAGGGTLLTQQGNQLQQNAASVGITLALTTTSFTNGGAITAAYFHDQSPCSGSNTSPQLSWTASGVDTGLIASYDLLCIDLDSSNFIHWSVDDIPTSTTSIAENGSWPGGVTINQTDYGTPVAGNGWEGPCPPSGTTHNYRITLFARDSSGNELTNATLNFTATRP